MERVWGDRAASASRTNSCGTALRGLPAERGSCGESEGVLRRGVVMGLRVSGFGDDLMLRRVRELSEVHSRSVECRYGS
jgi:hypothetical protein